MASPSTSFARARNHECSHGESSGTPRFVFPSLDQRQGADPSWAETMDTLRTPRKRDQKFWEWRRNERQLATLRKAKTRKPFGIIREMVRQEFERNVTL